MVREEKRLFFFSFLFLGVKKRNKVRNPKPELQEKKSAPLHFTSYICVNILGCAQGPHLWCW